MIVMFFNKAREVAASDEREADFDLGGCLEDLVPVQDNSPTPVVQVVILDEAAIVNVSTGFCRHFLIYDLSVPAVHHITTATCEQTSCVG